MREDERRPLSKAVLQKQMRDEARYSAMFSVIPVLFVTLLALLFTVMVSKLYAAPPFFWGFLVIGVIPCWVAVAILVYRAVKSVRLYRQASQEDLLEIVTDKVVNLTEEMELHRGGRYAYYDNACIVYLEAYGRHVIGSTLWSILHEGDEVYVAVMNREKPGVYGIYSTKTHRLVDK